MRGYLFPLDKRELAKLIRSFKSQKTFFNNREFEIKKVDAIVQYIYQANNKKHSIKTIPLLVEIDNLLAHDYFDRQSGYDTKVFIDLHKKHKNEYRDIHNKEGVIKFQSKSKFTSEELKNVDSPFSLVNEKYDREKNKTRENSFGYGILWNYYILQTGIILTFSFCSNI